MQHGGIRAKHTLLHIVPSEHTPGTARSNGPCAFGTAANLQRQHRRGALPASLKDRLPAIRAPVVSVVTPGDECGDEVRDVRLNPGVISERAATRSDLESRQTAKADSRRQRRVDFSKVGSVGEQRIDDDASGLEHDARAPRQSEPIHARVRRQAQTEHDREGQRFIWSWGDFPPVEGDPPVARPRDGIRDVPEASMPNPPVASDEG